MATIDDVYAAVTAMAVQVLAIKAKTDQLTFTQAGGPDAIVLGYTLGGAPISVVGPVLSAGGAQIVCGDDYLAVDNRALPFSSNAWPDLTGAVIKFSVRDVGSRIVEIANSQGSVITPAGDALVQVELTTGQTARLDPEHQYQFDVQAQLFSGHIVTLVAGPLVALRSISTP